MGDAGSWPGGRYQSALRIHLETAGRLTWELSPTKRGVKVESGSGGVAFKSVKNAIEELVQALDNLTDAWSPLRRYSSRHKAEMAEAVATAGERLSETLFGKDVATVARELSDPKLLQIDISLPNVELEWPLEFCLLPDKRAEKGVRYLGEMCLISRRPVTSNLYVSEDLEEQLGIGSSALTLVGYAEDDNLGSACIEHATPARPGVEEVFALKPLVGNLGDIDFLSPLGVGRSAVAMGVVADWLSKRRDVIHFNSHSDAPPHVENGSRSLRVRAGFSLERNDFQAPHNSGLVGPYDRMFFFLNACSSAYGSTDVTDSLGSTLLEHGAEIVVCSLGPIDDAMATEFATEFYSRLAVAGTTVAEAILEARRALIKSHGHPLALVYTAMGNEYFVLKKR